MRRSISATHGIPLAKIAFGDEPHFQTAVYAWGAIPEKLEYVDIFSIWTSPSSSNAKKDDMQASES